LTLLDKPTSVAALISDLIDAFGEASKIVNGNNVSAVDKASVFFNNATIGSKSAADGSFILRIAPGRYGLTISCVGFTTYHQMIILEKNNLVLADIALVPLTITLNEVKIKPVDDLLGNEIWTCFWSNSLGI
jgi:hypothetical protein